MQAEMNYVSTKYIDESRFFDVTDPDKSFWQYDINRLNKEDPSKGGYYIVSIDSKTGEAVEAYEFEDGMPSYLYY